jgi:glycosyltransferase involved in cell wall biosynthesis
MTRRLLYLFNDAGFFLSHRLPVARGAVAAGYEVHVATPGGPATGDVEALGFPHHPIALTRRGVHPALELRALVRLAALSRRLRPALVEHATIKPVLYGGLASRLAGSPPSVMWMTGLGFIFIATGRRAAAARATLAAGYRVALGSARTRVIFENPDDRDLFISDRLVAAGRARLIRGAGVDMEQFRPSAEEPGVPVVAFVARMLRDKGLAEFVAAAKALRGGGVRARFVLVGGADPGNPAGVSEGELRAWQEEGAVEWWGHQRDMPGIFRRAHLVCLPSYREGLPKALVEAAAAGRAIVATDVPGCREVVRHEWNGLLVPPRDAVPLAAALGRLIADPAERSRMAARGRAWVQERFSVAHVVRETLAVYDELAG